MASQVEIASSAPFGCVLKDHTRRDRDRLNRESNSRANSAAATQAAFQKNLKDLVRDHLHSCISVSPVSSADENSENHVNNNISLNHNPRQHLRCLTNQQDKNGNKNNNLDGSSTMSCKQARILDRWAANKAQEMVSTIEKQSQESEFFIDLQKSSSSAKENCHNSKPKNSSPGSNSGASSLVQMWEARLNRPEPKSDRSNICKNDSNSAPPTSRTSSTSSYCEIVSSPVEEPSRNFVVIDSSPNEDSLTDLDSAAQSSHSSVNFQSSDAGGESERIRIVDIIKRLTSDGNDNEQQGSSVGDLPSRRHSCSSDQSEPKSLSIIVNSPKIRGRQAFNDLLQQMEKERLRELESLSERQSVSKFPQRGRIQSMLRLRCLQRGMAIQNQQRSQLIRGTVVSDPNRWQQGSTNTNRLQQGSTISDTNRLQQGSTIMHLKERFSNASGVDNATSSLRDTSTEKIPKETPNNNPATKNESHSTLNHVIEEDNLSTLSQMIEDGHHQQDISIVSQQVLPPADDKLSQISEAIEEEEEEEEDVNEEASASSDVTWQGESSEGENFDRREGLGLTTQSLNNWDDEEDVLLEQQDFGGTHYDWFTDIARPRSYWEDQRQAWYQEMLNTSSDNSDIRQLLERRTVSTFLSSDFRDRMDQLMECHVQRQVIQEDEEFDDENQERVGQLILSFFQRHSHSEESQQQQQEDRDEIEGVREAEEEVYAEGREVQQEEIDEDEQREEEEEEESPPSVHSPSPFRSWNYNPQPQNHEVSDNSEQASIPSQNSAQHGQYFASPSHSSVEMELIYDLRGHMEQMQREMTELRKSMQAMEMQAKLHNSVHPVAETSKNLLEADMKKRTCCICHEKQVDSFLYRCGHMCTCLKCAHELQWACGKCPICRAPILDVVRAYLDS